MTSRSRANSLRSSSLGSLARIDSVSSCGIPSSPTPSSPTTPLGGGAEVLFESYLQKTPPLDRLIVSWKRRWFVLSKSDPHDPMSLDLSYYPDRSKRGKRGRINLSRFIGIRPNAKIGNKDNVFAIETEERQYILRAPDPITKNIWLAKLCELCGQELVYHVTIPDQRALAYNEGILRLSSPAAITVVNPSSNKVISEVTYSSIRRMGQTELAGRPAVWFETCNHPTAGLFFFLHPGSGEVAQGMIRELKMAAECCTGSIMIMEGCGEGSVSFISRKHYGCEEFPQTERQRILTTSMRPLPLLSRLSRPEAEIQPILRRVSEPVLHAVAPLGVPLDEVASCRRLQRANTSGQMPPLARRNTLDQFFQASTSSSQVSIDTGDGSDSGGGSDVFDPVLDSPVPRKLSAQSSLSSRRSSAGSSRGEGPEAGLAFPLHVSGGILESSCEEEEGLGSPRLLQTAAAAPIVPPRSEVSLRGPYVHTAVY